MTSSSSSTGDPPAGATMKIDPGNLAAAVSEASKKGRGGPDSWNPPYCGEIDMRIGRDGTWYYLGTPIGRLPMVKLFASVLRLEADGYYYLVTPVEKIRIRVDDAPFVVVELQANEAHQSLSFRTNIDQWVTAGPDHPIRVQTDPLTGEPAPYLMIRKGLEALINRPVFYELVGLAELAEVDGVEQLFVTSGGQRFSLGAVAA